jgi:hypothetical protein
VCALDGQGGAYPERRTAGALGPGSERDSAQVPVGSDSAGCVVALRVGRVAPQRAAGPHQVHEAPHARLEGDARARELHPGGRVVDADAGADHEAPTRERIQRGQALRQQNGCLQRRQDHGRAELHAPGARRHRGQQRQWLVPRARQDRLAGPDRVEAE